MSGKRKNFPSVEDQRSFLYRCKTDPIQYMVVVPLSENACEPEPVIEEAGMEYERPDQVVVDVNQIPKHVADSLARATFEMYREHFMKPKAEELQRAELYPKE